MLFIAFPSLGMQAPSTPTRGSIFSRKESQTSPTKTPQPYAKDSFRHLRDNIDIDFSSGAENLSSPENADTENTPEVPRKGSPTKLNSNVTLFRGASPTKRESISKFFAKLSPGRGEVSRRKNGELVRRVHKRKRRELDRDTYKPSGSDSESDEHTKPNKSKDSVQQVPTGPSSVVSFFSFIETHPNLPYILSWYAQLFLNVSWIAFVIYLVYSFWSTIRQDVDMKSEEVAAVILAEMAACTREFVENKCDRQNRVPALETVCDNWAKCMNRDPSAVGRAKVSAHTFAEIFNSFMEPISYKAMVWPYVVRPTRMRVTLISSAGFLSCFSIWLRWGLELRIRSLQEQKPSTASNSLREPGTASTDAISFRGSVLHTVSQSVWPDGNGSEITGYGEGE